LPAEKEIESGPLGAFNISRIVEGSSVFILSAKLKFDNSHTSEMSDSSLLDAVGDYNSKRYHTTMHEIWQFNISLKSMCAEVGLSDFSEYFAVVDKSYICLLFNSMVRGIIGK
jgi:hypothetical protein